MPSTTISRGNLLFEAVLNVNLTPTSVPANASSVQNFSVAGALMQDYVDIFFNGPQTQNIMVQSCWVSSANVVSIQFMNLSSVAITPSSGFYSVNIARPENSPLPSNLV